MKRSTAIACEPPVLAFKGTRDAIADAVIRSRKSEILLSSHLILSFLHATRVELINESINE